MKTAWQRGKSSDIKSLHSAITFIKYPYHKMAPCGLKYYFDYTTAQRTRFWTNFDGLNWFFENHFNYFRYLFQFTEILKIFRNAQIFKGFDLILPILLKEMHTRTYGYISLLKKSFLEIKFWYLCLIDKTNVTNHWWSNSTRLKRIKSDIVKKPLKLALIEKSTYLYYKY